MNALDKLLQATPYNVKNLLDGTWNKFKADSTFLSLDDDIQEQALYRAILCQPCEKNGECLYCHCDTPHMFYSSDKIDSQLKWGPMLEKDDWELFKALGFYNSISTKFNYDDKTKTLTFNVIGTEKLLMWDAEYIFINFMKYKVVKIQIQNVRSIIPQCDVVVECDDKLFEETNKRLTLMKNKALEQDGSKAAIKNTSGYQASVSKIDVVKFIQPVFNFGTVAQKDKVNGTFEFTNISDKTIKIDSCKATCGCTTPSFTKDEIKPGETGSLSFVLDTTNKKNITSTTIMVGFNVNGVIHEYTVVVQGNVR